MSKKITYNSWRKKRMTLATEILSDMKHQLIRCKVALIISLAGNIIQTIALIIR